MEAFHQFIIETVSKHLFSNQRVREMLSELMESQAIRRYENSGHLDRIRAELNETEERNLAKAAGDRELGKLQPTAKLTEKTVKKFADFVRTQLAEGNLQFKRYYLRAVIDRIIVSENSIKIVMDQIAVEPTALTHASGNTGPTVVRIFVREWRSE